MKRLVAAAIVLLFASCSHYKYEVQKPIENSATTTYVQGFLFTICTPEEVYEVCGNPWGCVLINSRMVFCADDLPQEYCWHEVQHLIFGKMGETATNVQPASTLPYYE